jgi:hypothetical protein
MPNILDIIKTNDAGYVFFKNRNLSFKGDRGTFAQVARNEKGHITAITVKVAKKGIISSEYTDEMSQFCRQIGLDFAVMSCGDSKTVFI